MARRSRRSAAARAPRTGSATSVETPDLAPEASSRGIAKHHHGDRNGEHQRRQRSRDRGHRERERHEHEPARGARPHATAAVRTTQSRQVAPVSVSEKKPGAIAAPWRGKPDGARERRGSAAVEPAAKHEEQRGGESGQQQRDQRRRAEQHARNEGEPEAERILRREPGRDEDVCLLEELRDRRRVARDLAPGEQPCLQHVGDLITDRRQGVERAPRTPGHDDGGQRGEQPARSPAGAGTPDSRRGAAGQRSATTASSATSAAPSHVIARGARPSRSRSAARSVARCRVLPSPGSRVRRWP